MPRMSTLAISKFPRKPKIRLERLERLDPVVGVRLSVELTTGYDVGCIHVSTGDWIRLERLDPVKRTVSVICVSCCRRWLDPDSEVSGLRLDPSCRRGLNPVGWRWWSPGCQQWKSPGCRRWLDPSCRRWLDATGCSAINDVGIRKGIII